ncbi:MAG: hypothetical protein ACJ788_05005 [Ktedonobacteraceae bacterium]|jgi:hypothetical protein
MNHLRRGLVAGVFAGLLVALALFVDYGPGANLSTIAHWFALVGTGADKLIGFVLLLLLGAAFGLLFGVVVGRRVFTMDQLVLAGLVTGFVWWVVLLLGTVIRQMQQSVYDMMLFLVISLLYGLALGSLYVQLPQRKVRG